MVVVVLYAVSAEGKYVTKALSERVSVSGHTHVGFINGNKVVCIETQMGKVNAACESALAIKTYAPDVVISTGIGGAYPGTGLNIGDVAVSTCEIYGDEGVLLKDGFLDTFQMGIPLLKKGKKLFYNEFDMDTPITQKAYEIISDGLTGYGVRKGRFLTVSSCTGYSERALMLTYKHSAICENMEGAAVAHVCTKYNVPVIEIRGISNIVSDRDKSNWNIMLAIKNYSSSVILLLKSLNTQRLQTCLK
ncbi:MAG: futalosine hydrolase [Nitrospirae bacterium]|nr:futalosine hydrolase [Nitrospirota bacterium]MBF0535637.1 futalosine hydrolase [Nitrospirota bacterium]MBF0616943.1 futalosine hydrolase [Nitrospirota bacterium]